MPKGEYTRTEAGRRAYFVVTGIELPNTLTHDEIKAYSHALPEEPVSYTHLRGTSYSATGFSCRRPIRIPGRHTTRS